MTMPPRLRKLTLTAHVASSVGWLGVTAVFLGLAVVGLTSRESGTVRGAYLVMEPVAWWILIPFAVTSLVTGLIQSLGTPWGLFRHYWVFFKLAITVLVILLLLGYLGTFVHMAELAADQGTDLNAVRSASPAIHASLALFVLLVATVLAIYKPRGVTPYGSRRWRG
jgi:hypothetical protein